jgi:hypothetical protein
MPITIPMPPQLARRPWPQPIRSLARLEEITGRHPQWVSRPLVLSYTREELLTVALHLARGKRWCTAMRLALGPTRWEMLGGRQSKQAETRAVCTMREVTQEVDRVREIDRIEACMDSTERRLHMARLARRSGTPPAGVIGACRLDAELAGDLDGRPHVDVSVNAVLASLQGSLGLPSEAERSAGGGSGQVVSIPAAGAGAGCVRPSEARGPVAEAGVAREAGQADEVAAEGRGVAGPVLLASGLAGRPAAVGHPLDEPGGAGRRIVAEAQVDESDCVTEDGPEGWP